jgi:ABC-type sugar transport system ATPase subunit
MTVHPGESPPVTVASPAPIIEGRGLVKRFGGAVAVQSVDIVVRPGDIHAVVGENGAGKSTLMRMLAGVLSPTEGAVLVDGEPLEMGSAKAALEAGVALVHQELSLVPEMTVAENILLGFTPTRAGGFIDRRRQREIARSAMEEIGVRVDLDEPIARLSVALRQFVEIARAVARQPRVLILDEPTATLTPAETEYLLEMLERLADRGIAIIYISHRIPEIFAICKQVTILRDGERVHTGLVEDLTAGAMVDLMVGRELKRELEAHRESSEPGEVVLSARGITAPGVQGIDLDVRAGEVVGIGGLVGAGRTELIRAIIGADPRTGGIATLDVDGHTHDIRSYRQAVERGLAYVPEERRSDGLALTMSVKDNITLPNRKRLSRSTVLLPGRIRRFAQRLADDVKLRPPTITAEVGSYSGGNQQKVVLAKWLGHEPRLIVLDEPTRGVDVGAKAEIHRLVRALADDGTAVLVVSSDLPELLELADVIHVVRDGEIVGSLPAGIADESSVMALAAGGTSATDA